MKGHSISKNHKEECYSASSLCLNFFPREITSEDNGEAELEQIITCQKSHFSDNVPYLNLFLKKEKQREITFHHLLGKK